MYGIGVDSTVQEILYSLGGSGRPHISPILHLSDLSRIYLAREPGSGGCVCGNSSAFKTRNTKQVWGETLTARRVVLMELETYSSSHMHIWSVFCQCVTIMCLDRGVASAAPAGAASRSRLTALGLSLSERRVRRPPQTAL